MSDVAQMDADIVIIGSGVAGALTAYKLAQKGFKVLVLEAGPRVDRADIVTAFTKAHQLNFVSGYPSPEWAPIPDWADHKNPYIEHIGPEKTNPEYLRVVGGTTWHWSATAFRMAPVEFKMKSRYGVGADWPLDYKALEPFYCDAEKEMGISGDTKESHKISPRSQPYPLPPIPISHYERAVSGILGKSGIHFIARPSARNSQPYQDRVACQGFGTCSPICPSGAQYSAHIHVALAEKAGARVVQNARVDRLVTDSNGNIIAAEGRRSDGTEFSAHGRSFVLAAGGLETPRLLMMNVSERYPNGLANRSGHVGKNFMEHPSLQCRMLMPTPVYPGFGPQETAISHTFSDGDFRKLHSGWMLTINNVIRLHDIANEVLLKGLAPPQLDQAIRDRAIRHVEFEAQLEQLPDPKNGITLNWDKRDSAGQPLMRFYYSHSDYERAGFTHARENMLRMVKLLGGEFLNFNGPYGHSHMMGTTSMGKDPAHSVVDAQCRAHDHPNLFIAGSSVFPTSGTANPTLTIAALALRNADAIGQQLAG